jgi:hypothetical protein
MAKNGLGIMVSFDIYTSLLNVVVVIKLHTTS